MHGAHYNPDGWQKLGSADSWEDHDAGRLDHFFFGEARSSSSHGPNESGEWYPVMLYVALGNENEVSVFESPFGMSQFK